MIKFQKIKYNLLSLEYQIQDRGYFAVRTNFFPFLSLHFVQKIETKIISEINQKAMEIPKPRKLVNYLVLRIMT